MSNISTNQVSQFFVAKSTVDIVNSAKDSSYYIIIDGKERTDLIQSAAHVKSVTVAASTDASQKLQRKGFLIKLNEEVNGGNAVVGQHYNVSVTFRCPAGEQLAYHKFAEAYAKTEDAATLLQGLAKSFLANQNVEPEALYQLILPNGTAITKANITSITADGFYVVEPVPTWVLGIFPQTLMKMSIATAPITLNGEEETEILSSYKPVVAPGVAAIPNSKKVADLEYFCKGERGNSAALDAPRCAQINPGLQIDPEDTAGYNLLVAHVSFVGEEVHNQASDKDIIIATKLAKSNLDTLKTKILAGK